MSLSDDPDFIEISAVLEKNTGRLMDINHKTYQDVRQEIARLNRHRDHFNELIDDMCEALAIGAMLTANMVRDMIAEEYDIVPINEEEQSDEDELGDD